jgi:hypothetical protein
VLDQSAVDREVLTREELADFYTKVACTAKRNFEHECKKTFATKSASMACTRFRRHRLRCFNGAGGGSWRDGSLPASTSLRRCA